MIRIIMVVAAVLATPHGAAAAESRSEAPTRTGDPIGTATMTATREIVLDLRSVECDGTVVESQVRYRPDDPNFAAVAAHVGGLAPGRTKPVRAWPAEPCPQR